MNNLTQTRKSTDRSGLKKAKKDELDRGQALVFSLNFFVSTLSSSASFFASLIYCLLFMRLT